MADSAPADIHGMLIAAESTSTPISEASFSDDDRKSFLDLEGACYLDGGEPNFLDEKEKHVDLEIGRGRPPQLETNIVQTD